MHILLPQIQIFVCCCFHFLTQQVFFCSCFTFLFYFFSFFPFMLSLCCCWLKQKTSHKTIFNGQVYKFVQEIPINIFYSFLIAQGYKVQVQFCRYMYIHCTHSTVDTVKRKETPARKKTNHLCLQSI